MRPKTTVLYLILTLVLLAAVAASAYSLTRLLRIREHRRIEEAELAAEIQGILDYCRDQILRHPDFDLSEEHSFLTRFAQASPRDQLTDRDKLVEFSQALARGLLFRVAGLKEGQEKWSEAVLYKTYSPNGFKALYEETHYPGVESIPQAPPITGDAQADGHIVDLARRRGYRLRTQAREDLLVQEGRHSLQQEAMNAWGQLRAAAAEEGIQLELVSAYRSVQRQRQIFLRELRGTLGARGGGRLTEEAIAAGQADEWIEEVLCFSSIPGFSKHHSGYTIDIFDPSDGYAFTEFDRSRGYEWISAHNYLNAKRFGFIPSYPDGAHGQGPEPEPWEYVWVGRDAVIVGVPGR